MFRHANPTPPSSFALLSQKRYRSKSLRTRYKITPGFFDLCSLSLVKKFQKKLSQIPYKNRVLVSSPRAPLCDKPKRREINACGEGAKVQTIKNILFKNNKNVVEN